VGALGGVLIIGAVAAAYGLVAARLDRMWISGPMVFVAAGALVGPAVLGLDDPNLRTEWVRTTTELTLAVLLFVDASTIPLRDAERGVGMPARLLGIGLPLTALAGALVGLLVLPGLGWATCALLACMLAPTDAALGLAVVTNPAVPSRIRRSLNIESGLNDGLAAPFVSLLLAVVLAEERHGDWVLVSLRGIGVAVLLGAALGLVLGAAGRSALSKGWTQGAAAALVVLATPLLCYGTAVLCSANGFVATYVCGFAFGIGSRRALARQTSFAEDVGLYASFVVWAIFGMLFVGPVLQGGVPWRVVVYAALSLTVVRVAPVALALLGVGLRPVTTLFVGWFGPRGLASVVFALIAVESLDRGAGSNTVLAVATLTILGSVVLHGVSATPLARRYGRSVADLAPGSAELDDTGATMRPRRRSLAPED